MLIGDRAGAAATRSPRSTRRSPTRIVAHAHAATAAARRRRDRPRGRGGQRAWSRAAAAERAAALSPRRRAAARPPAGARRAGRPRGGKPWAEADADVCEAIDFLEYYAAGRRGAGPRPRADPAAGRAQHACATSPRGVTGVIAPWNFPLAIACRHGVRRAGDRQRRRPQARRAGAGVRQGGRRRAARRRRPARRAVAAARRRRAGQGAGRRPAHPHDRLHRLVRGGPADPRARGQGRPRPAPHQEGRRRDGRQERGHRRRRRRPRRRRPGAAEVSAFGFAGQKCSRGLARARPRSRSPTRWPSGWPARSRTLQVGPAEDFATDVPPVIDAAAQMRVQPLHRPGRAAATRVAAAAEALPAATASTSRRRCLVGLPDDHPVIQEEIFGPVLALQTGARRSSEACDAGRRVALRAHRRPVLALAAHDRGGRARARRSATCTSTARSPARWSAASRSAAAACPGTGPKAGGPDYLLQFVEARAVTENTVRHGLVV